MALGVDVDLRDLDKAFKRLERRGADLREIWRQVKRPFRQAQIKHIRDQRDDKGSKFRTLSLQTRLKRIGSSGRGKSFTKRGKLRKPVRRRLNKVLSAKLLSKVKFEVTPLSLSIESNIVGKSGKKWPGVHQHGGRAGRRARIPKRTFMYVDDELLARIVRDIQSALTRAWKR